MAQILARGFVPPTAGLPIRALDLLALNGSDLASALANEFDLPQPQIECSGTAALVVALSTLKSMAPERREVVVPAYTCPLVAIAVAHCGLELKVCDIEKDSLDFDTTHLRQLCGANTLAIVPTHLGGRIVDVDSAMYIARDVGAWVIEDAAQALGATTANGAIGLRGDIGFFSLAVGKGLTIFEGGALVTRDPELRDAMRRMRGQVIPRSMYWELRRSIELIGYAVLYRPSGLGIAYGKPLRKALARGDWIDAAGDDFSLEIPLHRPGVWRRAVGVSALKRLRAFHQTTQLQGQTRAAKLAAIPGVDLVRDTEAMADARGVWPVILLRMPSKAARDKLLREHWGEGLGFSAPFVHALPDYENYSSVVPPALPEDLPNGRDWASRLIALSNSPWLDDARFDQACKAIESANSHE